MRRPKRLRLGARDASVEGDDGLMIVRAWGGTHMADEAAPGRRDFLQHMAAAAGMVPVTPTLLGAAGGSAMAAAPADTGSGHAAAGERSWNKEETAHET